MSALSPLESQVIFLLASGYRCGQVQVKLNISRKVFDSCARRFRLKLKAATTYQAIAQWALYVQDRPALRPTA